MSMYPAEYMRAVSARPRARSSPPRFLKTSRQCTISVVMPPPHRTPSLQRVPLLLALQAVVVVQLLLSVLLACGHSSIETNSSWLPLQSTSFEGVPAGEMGCRFQTEVCTAAYDCRSIDWVADWEQAQGAALTAAEEAAHSPNDACGSSLRPTGEPRLSSRSLTRS
eukprot:COSAG02_NODE_7627_length_2927_cov_1.473833_1_plen_166_part_00